MAHISEYEVEDIFIGRLESIGYKFIKLDNYDDVLANFREQLAKFNAKKLTEKGHDASCPFSVNFFALNFASCSRKLASTSS